MSCSYPLNPGRSPRRGCAWLPSAPLRQLWVLGSPHHHPSRPLPGRVCPLPSLLDCLQNKGSLSGRTGHFPSGQWEGAGAILRLLLLLEPQCPRAATDRTRSLDPGFQALLGRCKESELVTGRVVIIPPDIPGEPEINPSQSKSQVLHTPQPMNWNNPLARSGPQFPQL